MRVLRGRQALVTGAASGIGRAIAIALAQEGAHLWLVDIDEDGLRETISQIGDAHVEIVAKRCDVTQREQVSACVADIVSRWGGVDILVNNAGVVHYGPTASMTRSQWDRMLQVNLLAPVQFVHELLPHMLDRPEAHLVNMASVLGLVGMARVAAYNCTKFGLVGLSESLRIEYGRSGLGVTAVCPGFVTTRLFANGTCSHAGRNTPTPPAWTRTTPEKVARRTIRAIYKNQRQVVMTPLAHLIFWAKRLAPWLLDAAAQLGRGRAMRKKMARLQAEGKLPNCDPSRKAA